MNFLGLLNLTKHKKFNVKTLTRVSIIFAMTTITTIFQAGKMAQGATWISLPFKKKSVRNFTAIK